MKQNTNKTCLFCQKYQQDGSFSLVLAKALYSKYSQSQNFYYQRDVNDILEEKHTKARIRFYDNNTYDTDQDYLRRFYQLYESDTRIPSLLEYYKYHINLPRNFYSNLINRRMEKARNLQYRRIKQELGIVNEIQTRQIKEKDTSDDCSVGEMKNLLKDLKLESTQPDYSKITNSTILKDLVSQIGNFNEIADPFDFLEPKLSIKFPTQTPSIGLKLNIEKQVKMKLKGPFTSRYPKLTTSNKPPPTVKIIIQQPLKPPSKKGSVTSRVKSRQASMGNIDLVKSGQLSSRSNHNNNINTQGEGLMEFAIKIFSNQSTKIARKIPFSQNNNFFVKGNNSPQIRPLHNNEELKSQFKSLRSKILSPTRQSKSNVGSPVHRKKPQ